MSVRSAALETVHSAGPTLLRISALANAPQPGSPQAPQLVPGSMSVTCSRRGSSSTLKNR